MANYLHLGMVAAGFQAAPSVARVAPFNNVGREQAAMLMNDPEDVELSRAMVNADIEALSAQPKKTERGE